MNDKKLKPFPTLRGGVWGGGVPSSLPGGVWGGPSPVKPSPENFCIFQFKISHFEPYIVYICNISCNLWCPEYYQVTRIWEKPILLTSCPGAPVAPRNAASRYADRLYGRPGQKQKIFNLPWPWRGQGHYPHFTKVSGSFIRSMSPSRYFRGETGCAIVLDRSRSRSVTKWLNLSEETMCDNATW